MQVLSNQKGSIYRTIMMVVAVAAIVVLIVLLRKSFKLEESAPKLEKQAEESGVNLNEFR
jgi:hypothetical protein